MFLPAFFPPSFFFSPSLPPTSLHLCLLSHLFPFFLFPPFLSFALSCTCQTKTSGQRSPSSCILLMASSVPIGSHRYSFYMSLGLPCNLIVKNLYFIYHYWSYILNFEGWVWYNPSTIQSKGSLMWDHGFKRNKTGSSQARLSHSITLHNDQAKPSYIESIPKIIRCTTMQCIVLGVEK